MSEVIPIQKWCGQGQPHYAHGWQGRDQYGSPFPVQYTCAGCTGMTILHEQVGSVAHTLISPISALPHERYPGKDLTQPCDVCRHPLEAHTGAHQDGVPVSVCADCPSPGICRKYGVDTPGV